MKKKRAAGASFWNQEADRWGLDQRMGMADVYARDRESSFILQFLAIVPTSSVFDFGCGNGWTMSVIARSHPEIVVDGYEPNAKLRKLATSRDAPYTVHAKVPTKGQFDLVISQRVLTCIDPVHHKKTLEQLRGLVKPGKFCLLIEAFTDGLDELNRLRVAMNFRSLVPAKRNVYLEKKHLVALMQSMGFYPIDLGAYSRVFAHLPPNFLSNYAVAKYIIVPGLATEFQSPCELAGWIDQLLPRNVGNYSPVQAMLWGLSESEPKP